MRQTQPGQAGIRTRPGTFPVALIFVLLGTSLPAVADSFLIQAKPEQDAAIGANFDFFPVAAGADTHQNFPGANVRLRPGGGTEPTRPAQGVIEEGRTAIEFDLFPLSGIAPNTIESVRFTVNVNSLTNIGSGQLTPFANLLVRGYDGDGLMTFNDFGSIKGTSPEPNLGFSFAPPALTPLAAVPVSVTGLITLDITPFVRDQVVRGIRFSGINLAIDLATLPAPNSLANDTDFFIQTTSADEGRVPFLTVSTTAAPEPAMFPLLVFTSLIVIFRRYRRMRSSKP